MRADNSHHLVAAARRRALGTRARAVRTLRRLDGAGRPVSFDIVAREAKVSRSWLYGQADLRAEISRLRAQQGDGQGRPSGSPPVPARQRASEASLRRRLEAVNGEIRRLREENRELREQLARALGERRAASNHLSSNGRSATIGPCS
jgi:HAMP domain-containing protein